MADELVVGTNQPALVVLSGTARRYPGTVHAVDANLDASPFRARCGVLVAFRYPGEQWPPGLIENWCPSCVRMTHGAWIPSS